MRAGLRPFLLVVDGVPLLRRPSGACRWPRCMSSPSWVLDSSPAMGGIGARSLLRGMGEPIRRVQLGKLRPRKNSWSELKAQLSQAMDFGQRRNGHQGRLPMLSASGPGKAWTTSVVLSLAAQACLEGREPCRDRRGGRGVFSLSLHLSFVPHRAQA